MKSSRPLRLSSMNDSSNKPSSLRSSDGKWRDHGASGNGGTIIWFVVFCCCCWNEISVLFLIKHSSSKLTLLLFSNSFFNHSNSLNLLRTLDSFSLKTLQFVWFKFQEISFVFFSSHSSQLSYAEKSNLGFHFIISILFGSDNLGLWVQHSYLNKLHIRFILTSKIQMNYNITRLSITTRLKLEIKKN